MMIHAMKVRSNTRMHFNSYSDRHQYEPITTNNGLQDLITTSNSPTTICQHDSLDCLAHRLPDHQVWYYLVYHTRNSASVTRS